MKEAAGFRGIHVLVLVAMSMVLAVSCDILFPPEDTKAPGNVTGLVATPGDRQVELVWADPSDQDVRHFELTYVPGGAAPIKIASGVYRALVVNLVNGTAYTFTVKGVDFEGNRSSGAQATTTPTAVDTTPPAELASVTAVAGPNWVDLSWPAVDADEVDQILITWAGHAPVLLDGSADSYRAEGLEPYVEVTFTLKTVDHSGNPSTGITAAETPDLALDTVPPGPVVGLDGEAGSSVATLSWTDPADKDVARIQVSYSPGGPAQPIVVACGIETCQIIGLSNGTPYTFSVTAVDHTGNISPVETCEVTPSLSADTTPPAINAFWAVPSPAYLNQVVLLRTRVVDPESAFALSYDTDDDGAFDDSYTCSFPSGGTYTIRVRATSTGGSADASLSLTVDQASEPIVPAPVVWNGDFGITRWSGPGAQLDQLNGYNSITGSLYIDEFDGTNLAGTNTAGPVNLSQVGGDVVFYNCSYLVDLSALSGLKEIGGGLYFTASTNFSYYGIAASTLDGLAVETVGGSLVMANCPNLSDISALSSLQSIGGLRIQNCDLLSDLTGLDGLSLSLTTPIYLIDNAILADASLLSGIKGRGVYVDANLSLATLSGLGNSSMSDGASVHVVGNPALQGLQALGLTNAVTGSIRIEDNDNAAFTSLSGIAPTAGMSGDLVVSGNKCLSSVAALGTLRSLSGKLEIAGNEALANLTGLGGLSSTGSYILVDDNALLADIGALDVTAVGGSLTVSNNPSLVWAPDTVTDKSAIQTVGGDLVVSGNALLQSLDGLSELSVVSGNVTIDANPAMTDLSEFDPGTVGGSLTISSEAGLVWAAAPADLATIGTVGGDLVVSGNALLQSLGGLAVSRIVGGLTIQDNSVLASIAALSSLTGDANLGSLTISNNDSLPSLTGLEDITSIVGPVDISGNDPLASLTGLGNLASIVGSCSIAGNAGLASIAALGSLQTVIGPLTIEGNAGLGSLAGLGTLASVNGDLTIWDNSVLTNVSALGGVSITGGSLRFRGNSLLTSLAGMTGVTITTGHLLIGDRDVAGTYLASLDGLANLRINSGSISIADSLSLASLTALSTLDPLSTILDVAVNGCPSLTSLAGLDSIDSIRSLEISDNSGLSSMAAFEDNTDTHQITALSGSLIVHNNDSLTNLDGLNLVQSVGGYVQVSDNESLARLDLCALTTIASSVYIGYAPVWGYVNASLIVYENPSLVNVTDTPALGFGLDVLATTADRLAFYTNASLLPIAAAELDPLGLRGLTVGYW